MTPVRSISVAAIGERLSCMRIRRQQLPDQLQALLGLAVAAGAEAPPAVMQHPLHAERATPGRQRIVADMHRAARLHLVAEQTHDAGLHGTWYPASTPRAY